MDVKGARDGVGWSQRRLAEWLGVSQSLVAQWERGECEPSDEQQRNLEGLRRRSVVVARLDPYPLAPVGGRKGSRGAGGRLVWVNARNRAIQAGV